MSAERLLALLEIAESSPKPKVTSETFVDYLFPHTPLVSPSEFDYRLDLGFLEEQIDELYEHDKQGFVLDDSIRKKLEGYKTEIDNDVHWSHLYEQLNAEIDEYRNQTDKVERSRVIFYDPQDNELRITGITDGTYSSTDTEVVKLYKSVKTPLLGIHTHPTDALFSPQDFSTLLIRPLDETLLRGELVLCPNIQVLALSTTLTPALSNAQVEEFKKHWKGQFSTDRQEELEEKALKVRKIVSKKYELGKKIYKKHIDKIHEVAGRANVGEISMEEADKILDQVQASHLKETESLVEKFGLAEYVATKILEGSINNSKNTVLVDLARTVGVQLYVSTDRKNFYAATA